MNCGRSSFGLLVLAAWVAATALAQTQPSLPLPPPLPSPVDTFRELLSLTSIERAQRLTNYSAPARERLLEKLREYQALAPEERELRLRATELRWWLLPMMRVSATNRAGMLSLVPEPLRPLIKPRLEAWDLLPPPLQQERLNNEDIAQVFLQLKSRNAAQQEGLLRNLPPERQQLLRAGLDRWTGMTPDQRRATCEHFDRYFELSAREREKVLGTFTETERRQMEETLKSFAQLPVEKRRICVRSFEKFASMSPAERQQFLKNAERWEKMTQAERQSWRELVSRVPEFPPLPPGFGETAPPPVPGSFRSPPPPATNGGG